MALTACTPPAKGSPLFELGDDEMEMGVGIHGEPGRRREKLADANAIVDELLEAVVTDLPYSPGDNVALMINGLGGTPISELYILYGRAHQQLAEPRASHVRRSYVGEYCTSLDMAGASITLVKLDDEIVALLERARRDRHPHLLADASGRRPRTPPVGVVDLPRCAPVERPLACGHVGWRRRHRSRRRG